MVLRRVTLYQAQVPTSRDSPVHAREFDPLLQLRCRDVLRSDRAVVTLSPQMSVKALAEIVERAADQDLFPVIDGSGVLCGVVAAEALRIVASHPELHGLAVVADMMEPPASVGIDQDLRAAAELMVARDLRSVPITDSTGTIVGLLDEHDIAATVLGGGARRSP